MPKKTWTVELEDDTHTIEFDQRSWGGQCSIRVDGEVVQEGRIRSFEMGGDYPFQIDGTTLTVHARSRALAMTYDLSVDGHSLTTGNAIEALQPLPRWAWFFIIACLALIGVSVALGARGLILGAIAGGLGGGSAAICATIARDASRSRNLRIALCAVVTVIAWVGALVWTGQMDRTAQSSPASRSIPDPIPASNWEEFTSTAGRFSVSMPGTPVEETQVFDSDDGPIELYMYLVDNATEVFIAGYSDYPQRIVLQAGPQTMLQNARDGALANVGGTLVSERNISLKGYPGLEIEVDASDSPTQIAHLLARFYLVEDRLYQTLAVTLNDTSPNRERFLESFVLLSP